MGERRSHPWVVTAVALVMAVSSIGLLGMVGSGAMLPPTAARSGVPVALAGISPANPSLPPPSPAPNPSAPTGPSPAIDTAAIGSAQTATARALATGVDPREIFVPRPSATAAELTTAAEVGHVTPLYETTPAPMGLAEYGLRAGESDSIQPFILNTTSVRGSFDVPSIGGPNATYLLDSTPDGYGVQLNAVVTNVTLFGHGGYQFWTQDVMEFFPFVNAMILTTNVWNWSSPSEYLSPNVFYAHGPNGTQEGTTFYVASTLPFRISYPYNLTLTLVSNITDGRDSVYFSAYVTSPSGNYSYPDYDYVVFNSLAMGTSPLRVPANYTADGVNYNAIGGTNDFELTIGGPGSGSQTTLLTANATESLDFWNSSTNSYQSIPSAYSYGGETGETSIGASIAWATVASGSPVGVMTTGPSLLGGLWNASSPAGGPGHIELVVQPSNAFVLISNEEDLLSPFNSSGSEWAPTINTDSFTLPSGIYQIYVEESEYDEKVIDSVRVTAGSSTYLVQNLTHDDSQGVYTPLWAWTNQQIAHLSTSGSGTQADPYQIVTNQNSPLIEPFGALNDIGYPVYPGVYFLHTTAYTEFVDPPSLEVHVTTNSGTGFPTHNELPWWFYEDSNVAIIGAQNISGWFASSASSFPQESITEYLAFSVIVRNSSGFLIADNAFQSESRGLLLSGGTNNVVWGNTFSQITAPEPNGNLSSYSEGMSLAVLESGDLIYNNLFTNGPITAYSPAIQLYSHSGATYVNTWNLTPQSAPNVHYPSNWPAYPLSGSIIGGLAQAGNFWWDYGMQFSQYGRMNPYGALPYTESTGIANGGDFAPLLYSPLYHIVLEPEGLPSGTSWDYTVYQAGNFGNEFGSAIARAGEPVVVNLTSAPIGFYSVQLYSAGFLAQTRTFTVDANATVPLRFTAVYTATFTQSGLPHGMAWSVDLNGTTNEFISKTIEFLNLPNGSYAFTIGPVPGYVANPTSGSITIIGANDELTVNFTQLPRTYTASFEETGLPLGTNWSIMVDGITRASTSPTIVVEGLLTNGTWPFTIGTVVGFVASPASGTLTVTGANVTLGVFYGEREPELFSLTFSEIGLPAGTHWSLKVNGTSMQSTGSTIEFYLPNGTYLYTANPSGGFYPQSGASGVFVVLGESQSLSIPFAYTYPVTFSETGLPNGLLWFVNVTTADGAYWENYSFGGVIIFHLANGTYTYAISAPDGYTVSSSHGTTAIQGGPVTIPPVSISSTGGSAKPFPWIWILLVIIVVVVVIGLALILSRRKGGPGPNQRPGSPPDPPNRGSS